MARFMGEYQQVMDAKNRVFIPAKFREAMSETIYITKNLDGCLSAYSEEDWDKFYDRIMSLEPKESLKMARKILPYTLDLKPDAQGRVVVSASLKEFAKLEKEIYIIGVGNRFEIWDKKTRDDLLLNEDDGEEDPVVF